MPKVTDKEHWNENLSLAAWLCTVSRKKKWFQSCQALLLAWLRSHFGGKILSCSFSGDGLRCSCSQLLPGCTVFTYTPTSRPPLHTPPSLAHRGLITKGMARIPHDDSRLPQLLSPHRALVKSQCALLQEVNATMLSALISMTR